MYPNPFNPYPTVNPAYLQQANAPHINTGNQIVKVNGRNGAEMFQMAPNSSALLLDESAPMIWLAQTDGAGYKTLTAYDIKPHEEVPVPEPLSRSRPGKEHLQQEEPPFHQGRFDLLGNHSVKEG